MALKPSELGILKNREETRGRLLEALFPVRTLYQESDELAVGGATPERRSKASRRQFNGSEFRPNVLYGTPAEPAYARRGGKTNRE